MRLGIAPVPALWQKTDARIVDIARVQRLVVLRERGFGLILSRRKSLTSCRKAFISSF
jgi:hypothetical protein